MKNVTGVVANWKVASVDCYSQELVVKALKDVWGGRLAASWVLGILLDICDVPCHLDETWNHHKNSPLCAYLSVFRTVELGEEDPPYMLNGTNGLGSQIK